jgi:hypothetical protein
MMHGHHRIGSDDVDHTRQSCRLQQVETACGHNIAPGSIVLANHIRRPEPAAPLWLRWARSPAVVALGLLAGALALVPPFYRYWALTTSSPPEKSIAVLPFENLSNVREE